MADPCVGNPIVVENCLPGSPPAEWDISGAGDDSIQGFATDISVNHGGAIHFKINTDANDYRIDIYRLGYYQANGARYVTTVYPSVTLPQSQPACLTDPATLLTDCGNWAESASWAVPADAVSGLYIARLVRTVTGGASHVAFIVRDDASNSELLVKTSDTTWQAYNTWGGSSLYVGPARKVSYNRPFETRGSSTEDWLFNAEYPMVRWLEMNGYDVTYTTDVDTDRYTSEGPNRILNHKVFLSVGHDEYWSAGERAAVEAAREAGVNLAFFSGNESYWKTRWEPGTDPSAVPHRTLVCYKEGTLGENTCGSRCDPNPDNIWTGLWRGACEYPSLDGCRPENALSGNISWVGSTAAIQVPAGYGGLRFWRGTSVATLPAGDVASLSDGTLGYEWDFEQYEAFYPPGRIALSETILGGQTHHMSLYRYYTGSGVRRGLVFGAGSVQWSWGLDGNHDRGASTPDVRVQQATVNLLADMGAQPLSLQPPLVAVTASSDVTPPTSSIDSPLGGSTVQIGVPITIGGLASDSESGAVGVVEVSVDGGATWQRAEGREAWSFTWTPAAYGTVTIRSRATDDSGNIEDPGAGVTVTVGDTPSGPPNVPVANPDYYMSSRNVTLTVAAPGILLNDTDPDADPLTAVLRTGTGHGALTLGPDGSIVYTPALDWAGNDTFTYRAQDPAGHLSAAATVTLAVAQTCPCTIFAPTSEPVSPRETDPNPLEVGVRFSSDVNGFITAIRFYKHPENAGTHTAHLWTGVGQILATEEFTGESASGWQEVTLASPMPILAGATYIASYHSATGYAQDNHVFAGRGVDNPPLHALQDSTGEPNGIYSYCAAPGCFPITGYQSSNYYVDVVMALSVGPDHTAPAVTAVVPASGAVNASVGANVLANFSEPIDPATVSGSTFALRGPGGNLVPATIAYSVAGRQAVLDPSAPLAYDTIYTATVVGGGGDPVIRDLAGNLLEASFSWSFTTSSPPPPGPDEGPGGPILVIASSANPFGRYLAEILRAEGMNYFTATDLQNVTLDVLGQHRVVLLGESSLTPAQVTMLTAWVTGGGRLIAMRPDKQLADLLGLTDAGATLSNAYLRVDTASQPGRGLVGQTIQFHGIADLYAPNGAAALATLYTDAATPTVSPAVTLRAVGSGYAAAFTFDLARSVVYTRQGNPAWAGDERDGIGPLRSDDQFYGAKAGDAQPDWIDLNKVAIPQADEQQRLLAKLIQATDVMPLPRFWYFPKMKKAVVIMTGDQHGCCGGTRGRFAIYETQSPDGCSLADWECVRASSYVYINSDMTDAEAVTWTGKGFELGIHLDTGCADYTPESLDAMLSSQLASFASFLPGIPREDSHRTHCIAWSGWTTMPEKELAYGIRLDVNYYFWPPAWVGDRPGMFTGSGMPMRFAKLDGTLIDIYQAVTQMTDESGQSYPYTMDTLLDRAIGPEGYYGAFTANMHTDSSPHAGSDAIVASAKARGIPVVSGRQMLEWLDGRNASKFGDFAWDGNTLGFTVTAVAGARNLKGMVPRLAAVGALTGITRGGTPIAVTTETIKGIDYAIFDATTGAYAAAYAVDTTPPVITNVSAAPGFGGTAVIAWDTATEASDSRVDYGTEAGSLTAHVTDAALVTTHTLSLTGLLPSTTYSYRVISKDPFNNATTWPDPIDPPLSFTTPSAAFRDTTAADFAAGTTGACAWISETGDGEVILAPAAGAEFSGGTLPADWMMTPWGGGGTATVAGGRVTLSAAWIGTNALRPAGRAVEFVATFSGAPNQHIGFGIDFTQSVWAIFSTQGGGGLYARSNGSSTIDTPIAGSWLGAPHRYRIEWSASTVTYFVDGNQVAQHTVSIGSDMRILASDYVANDGDLVVDWMRMTPYPASCSYESRVLDSGQMATWGGLSWTAATPAGATIAMYARLGNTPTPDDGTWTDWSQVLAPGAAVSGQSRYLQYRADLATADLAMTPALLDVTLGYNLGADTTPPTITSRSPSAGATGVSTGASIIVQFSEPMDAVSITAATFRLRQSGAPSDLPAVVTYSGTTATLDPDAPLQPGTEYQVTVAGTVTDLAGNPLSADDTWSFATFITETFADTTSADFAAGSPGGCSIVAHTGDGELTLPPSFSEEFSGSDLPGGWATYDWPYDGTAGVYGIASGSVTVDGIRVDPDPAAYDAGRSLEFMATFGADAFQHVGFGAGNNEPPSEIYNTTPWAIFSTGPTTTSLLARTWSNDGNHDQVLTPPEGVNWIGTPHRYRIEWSAASVSYFIDGALVATQGYSQTATMRPAISDLNRGTAGLAVDWIRMSPYPASCAFESRVLDAGRPVHWAGLVATGSLASGTAYGFETRSGGTVLPDGSWSGWKPVTAGMIAVPNARYVQYRATLTTTNDLLTPELQRVDITLDACSPEVCNGLDDDCDGTIDNGNPGGGGACVTGLPGACATGTLVCQSGGLVCVPNTHPSAEICDGVDNDCDGTIDNGGNALCDDGIVCNGAETCGGALGCHAGTPVTCAALDQCHDAGVCESGTGFCTNPVKADGAGCNDGNACTRTDTCQSGVCTGSNPVICNDNNPCTVDLCDAGSGVCLHTPSGVCGVSGTVYYYRNNLPGSGTEPTLKPVPNVGIDGNGDAAADATTGSDGAYVVGNLAGNTRVAPLAKLGGPRAADHNGAITSLDASAIARSAVGLITLSPNQRVAGDVTGNGTVGATDASQVARFAIGMVNHFDVAATTGSDWKFLRCDNYAYPGDPGCGGPVYDFTPLMQAETGRNFYAVLYGDVTGNWQAASGSTSPADLGGTSPEEQAAIVADQRLAQQFTPEVVRRAATARVSPQAGLSIGGWATPLKAGERRQVTLDLANADGILGLDLVLKYDASRIRIVGVRTAGIGAGQNLAQADIAGTLRIAAYGVLPLAGSGPVLTVTVEALKTVGRQAPLTVSGQANEGTIPLAVIQGRRQSPRADR
jgi:hypothetical protein